MGDQICTKCGMINGKGYRSCNGCGKPLG